MRCSASANASPLPLAEARATRGRRGGHTSRRPYGRNWLLPAATLTALALAAAGCGGSDAAAPPASGTAEDPGVIHVHAVGVDPGDSSVLLATHTGLFRLPPGGDRAQLVGKLRQDTMGFTVIGADRYLGSGHPDIRTGQPPLLGLISSGDGGRTWSSVSLLGKVDFHILRAAGTRVVGMDSQTGAVLVSDDSGKRWARRTPPGDLVDLVLDPTDPDRFVASTTDGLVSSDDAGRTWTTLADGPGFLAWPTDDALLRMGPDGGVAVSDDAGRTWQGRGTAGAEPSAFTAVTEMRLLATLHDGGLVESRDGGASWAALAELE